MTQMGRIIMPACPADRDFFIPRSQINPRLTSRAGVITL